MSYIGDFNLGDTFDTKFTTRQISGAPATLSSSPVISAYVGNSTTEITAGITLTVDFDSRTGLNNVRVVATSGNGYATASNYQLVITTGTVNSVSVVGEVIAEFSIEARSAGLKPTVAGRTLDVSSTGEAGIDWANVGSPTTAVDLSGTTIKTTQKVDVDTIKTNPVVNGGTITFPTNATVASTTNITAGTVTTATNVTTVNGLANNVITAASINADAITAAKIADGAIDAATFAAGAINAAAIAADAITDAKVAADVTIASVTGAVGSVTGNVGGNVTGTIGGLTAAALKDFFDTDSATTYASAVAGSVVKEIADNAGGASLTPSDIADEVQTRTIAAVTTVGTVTTVSDKTGYRLSATGVDDIFDEAVEGTTTLRQMARGWFAALLGKSSGHESGTPKYRDIADSKNRIDATTDANGNRTAVTTDLT